MVYILHVMYEIQGFSGILGKKVAKDAEYAIIGLEV